MAAELPLVGLITTGEVITGAPSGDVTSNLNVSPSWNVRPVNSFVPPAVPCNL